MKGPFGGRILGSLGETPRVYKGGRSNSVPDGTMARPRVAVVSGHRYCQEETEPYAGGPDTACRRVVRSGLADLLVPTGGEGEHPR